MNGSLYGGLRRATQTLGSICVAAVVLSLVACGGGGSSGGDRRPMADPPIGMTPTTDPPVGMTPATPTAPIPPAPPQDDPGAPSPTVLTLTARAVKTLGFTWLPSGGTTEYRLLENLVGQPAFQTVATLPPDVLSQDLTVFLPNRINARYVLLACNGPNSCSSSRVEILTPEILGQAIGYVKPSNTVADPAGVMLPTQEPGSDVLDFSADGKTLVFGVSQEDGVGVGINSSQDVGDRGNNSGAVYVLVNEGGLWSQQAYIKANDSGIGLNFGQSVSLSADGNTLAVGATERSIFSEDPDGTDTPFIMAKTAMPNGAVYIFTRSGTTWTQETILRAAFPDADDLFGLSVSIADDGNTVAVGAAFEAGGSQTDPGDDSVPRSGAAYVFTRNGTAWDQTYLKAPIPTQGDGFGLALSLAGDGQTLAVAAPNQANARGAVYIFNRNAGGWTRQDRAVTADPSAEVDNFGFSLSLSRDGRTLAAGASQIDLFGPPTGPGAVFVFAPNASNVYEQQAVIKAKVTDSTGGDAGDAFSTVSLTDDGNTLVVGAGTEGGAGKGFIGDPADNLAAASGAAYIFTRSGTTWSQQTYIKAPNTEAFDNFGFCVAIAGDGSVLGVMAPREASVARGVGGNQDDNTARASGGAVYLY